MVTWWTDEGSFRAYMRSTEHRQSHDRVVRGADALRPAGLDRYRVVAR
jgi:heme-degrading monooxygenase HmoA